MSCSRIWFCLLQSTQVVRTHSSVSFPRVKPPKAALRAWRNTLASIGPLCFKAVSCSFSVRDWFRQFQKHTNQVKQLVFSGYGDFVVCSNFFESRVPMCRPSWPQTYRELPASASWELGLRACTTMADLALLLLCVAMVSSFSLS